MPISSKKSNAENAKKNVSAIANVLVKKFHFLLHLNQKKRKTMRIKTEVWSLLTTQSKNKLYYTCEHVSLDKRAV